MRYFSILLILFLTSFTFFNNNNQKQANLSGTWELVSLKELDSKDWLDPNPDIVYRKHVTKTHFTWSQFNTKTNTLVGLGGGTYMINEEGEYVENINFFYPAGTGEKGQSIPFKMEVKDGNWYHSGYIKQISVDENGEVVMTGKEYIDEVWKRVSSDKNPPNPLNGSWILSAFRHEESKDYQEYPEFTGYLKLITDTDFIWVKYDKEGDQVFAAGGGPYEYKDGKYTENIQMQYPSGGDVLGQQVVFNPIVESHKWTHIGLIKTENNEYPIDEIWVPYSSNIEDETAFNY